MTRLLSLRPPSARVLAALVLAAVCAHAVSSAQQKAPVFRTRVDLMQLDVTVLDKTGRPVRGLTKEDFTLFEDNAQQTIQGFTAIDLPEREASGPAWTDEVSRDVGSNDLDNARLFVLIIDDAFGMGAMNAVSKAAPAMPDPWAIREMKKTAEAFVEMLGPRDMAGVVYTGTTKKHAQNLTTDRAKLTRAVGAYPDNDGTLIFDRRDLPGREARNQCYAAKETLRMVEAVVLQLASLPDRRKSIVYFGGSLPWASMPDSDVCGTYWMWRDVFAAAQQGSVTINPIQTAGFPAPYDKYISVADYTGGHAVFNTSDFAPGIKRIFQESSSYYLLAYQPTKGLEDGTFRKIRVVVNRPDVEVVTRRNYWAPRTRSTDAPPPEPNPQVKALSGLIPDATLKLRATGAAFPVPGTARAVIALTVGITQPAFAGRTPEQVELLVRSFTVTGDPTAGDTQTIPITVPAPRADQETSPYEVLARLEVTKPGSYHVRLSAQSAASNTRGSVYLDVEVPDFRKDRLSLSGVLVSALPAAGPVAPPRLLADLNAMPPTTTRNYSTGDLVTTFMRVYQGESKPQPVTMTITIQDGGGVRVLQTKETIAAAQFAGDQGAPFQYRIPLASLTGSGVRDYVISFEAAAGRQTVRRDVVFQLR